MKTSIHYTLHPYQLTFKEPAGTSRGIYHTREGWLLEARDHEGRWGMGECAPLPDLSAEAGPQFPETIAEAIATINEMGVIDWEALRALPSLVFALEGANIQLMRGTSAWGDPRFASGEMGIPINGLIWMGDYPTMKARLEAKLKAGFRCIKIKIGAIDFEKECALLHQIRRDYDAQTIEIRVDANGGFTPNDALEKLKTLATFDLHSIEQPIKAKQWEALAQLCEESPIPIALDEELIGLTTPEAKAEMLQCVRPDYVVLKPSLHGGLRGAREWIELAKTVNAGFWVTSALESNIGLNVIAQWVSTLGVTMPQGLGTGALFKTNAAVPLSVLGDKLYYRGRSLDEASWKAML